MTMSLNKLQISKEDECKLREADISVPRRLCEAKKVCEYLKSFWKFVIYISRQTRCVRERKEPLKSLVL
jgi:hypothetical protein